VLVPAPVKAALADRVGGPEVTKWEDVSRILESISASFPQGSEQYQALKEAAWAYLYVNSQNDLKERFSEFRSLSNKELSEAQKEHLRSMGIEP
jgi:hypothetical protein